MSEIGKTGTPEAAKRQAIRKLGDLSEQIKKMQSGMEAGSFEMMQQMLKQLRSMQNGFSEQLQQALARANPAG